MKITDKKSSKKSINERDKIKSMIETIKSSRAQNQKIKREKKQLDKIESKTKAKKKQQSQEKKKKTQKRKPSNKKNKTQKTNNMKSSEKDKNKCPPNMSPLKTKDGLLCVGKCPHSGGPIYYNPSIDKLVCKWHGSQFKTSGKVLTPPAMENLKIKKIK